MIKVVVVIPYPELRDQALAIVRELGSPNIQFEITHNYGTKVEDMGFRDADVIVARGLTHQAIKDYYVDSAVLELPVGAYDLIRAVRRSRTEHGASKIAIIGSDSIHYDEEALQAATATGLRVFMIRNEAEILAALEEGERQGFDTMVGGLTACTMAGNRGWKTSHFPTSDETLRGGIKEAVNTAGVIFSERAKAEISRTILQNTREAIMYFDRSGILAQHNRRVFETLNIPADEAIAGRAAEELFDDRQILSLVRGRGEASGVIKTVNQAVVLCDFVPVRMAEETIGVICSFQRANEIQAAENKIRKELHRKGLVARYRFEHIIHSSPVLGETIATARKYGGVDANVLLVGETGTGKEMFAQSIHNASRRRAGPFVAVNCAAFPENLLESELFGYVEGAFSGAARGGKTGLFELAHGGTLFLDEIGEIPLNLQATLLRALQEGEIRKIGDDRVIPVNVRIIAATNIDLRERVEEEKFRMDLLYRLDVLSLWIPPLRERREDIAHIARHYLQFYRAQYGKSAVRLTDAALEAFKLHDWPGNTRELKNVCERLVVLSDDGTEITRESVEQLLRISGKRPSGRFHAPATPDFSAMNENQNVEQLVQFANSFKMNKSDIATMLGISRTTLWRRMNKLGKRNETQ